jgi:hypothetical protein
MRGSISRDCGEVRPIGSLGFIKKGGRMLRHVFVLVGLLAVVGSLSAVLTYIRAGNMSPLTDIRSKGLATVQKGNLLFFGIEIPLLVGVITFFVYHGMLARSAATVHGTFLLLAVGIGIILTILAAVVFKMRGLAEFVLLHIMYVVAFGWIMPMLWAV